MLDLVKLQANMQPMIKLGCKIHGSLIVNRASPFGTDCTFDRFPTITKSHAASLWLVAKGDFARPEELLAGQGYRRSDFPVPISSLDASVVAKMVGNSFTVSVFEQLLRGLLPAIGVRCAS